MRNAPTPELIAQVRAGRDAGLSALAIARQLGVTKGRISGLIRRHIQGIKDPPQAYVPRPRKRVPRAPKVPPSPIAPITHERCQWVIGNPRRPWRFCDAPVAELGCAWCATHKAVVYVRRPKALAA